MQFCYLPTKEEPAHWDNSDLYKQCGLGVVRALSKIHHLHFCPVGVLKDLGTILTPFGEIHLKVIRRHVSPELERFDYSGTLSHPNDAAPVGNCSCSFIRTRNANIRIPIDALRAECAAISEPDIQEWFDSLGSLSSTEVEEIFNITGLMTLNKIWIEKAHRGSFAWKALFYSMTALVLTHLRRNPGYLYVQPRPMFQVDTPGSAPSSAIAKHVLRLQRFYRLHLNAEALPLSGCRNGSMRAHIPEDLINAVMDALLKRR